MKKAYITLTGSLMGVAQGAVLELEEDDVVSQGLLGTLFAEAPEGSKPTDLGKLDVAPAPNTAVGDGVGDPAGNDGGKADTSPAKSDTPVSAPAKPVPPVPAPAKPVPPVPPKPVVPPIPPKKAEPVKTEEAKTTEPAKTVANPAGAQAAVKPE